jgi:16S rRNA (guanine966-N2)-methyltransferase
LGAGIVTIKGGGRAPLLGETLVNFGKSARQAASRRAQPRVLRIIGGAWRGRRLRFPPVPEIRPTPDRVRETLFNWLGSRVAGARCLDLFAGSGALGLEALSRGAGHVTFVERDPLAARELRARLAEWKATGAHVEPTEALHFLKGHAQAFDIAFLDPPFASGVLGDAARLLEERSWLAPGALIYVETDAQGTLAALPESWKSAKAKQAGAVGYHLYARGQQPRLPKAANK